jgi:CheY-specific phosphatase CheX
MESKLVIAFVESVQDVFRTMLRVPVRVGKPRLERSADRGAPQAEGVDALAT